MNFLQCLASITVFALMALVFGLMCVSGPVRNSDLLQQASAGRGPREWEA